MSKYTHTHRDKYHLYFTKQTEHQISTPLTDLNYLPVLKVNMLVLTNLSVCRSGSPTAAPSGGGRRSSGTRRGRGAPPRWSLRGRQARGAAVALCWAPPAPQGPPPHQAPSPGCLSTPASTRCIPPFRSRALWRTPTGSKLN